MKTLITNYTFIPAAKQVIFNDYTSIELERVLLITEVKYTNSILYNFAAVNFGGTVSGNVLTLAQDVTTLPSDIELQIYYDNEKTPASDEVANALYEVARKLDFLNAVRGVSADLRVSPLSTPNMSTLTTLSNLASLSGWGTATMVKDFDNLTAINSNINNIA